MKKTDLSSIENQIVSGGFDTTCFSEIEVINADTVVEVFSHLFSNFLPSSDKQNQGWDLGWDDASYDVWDLS